MQFDWLVRELPPGRGRDFCVGDVHGMFDWLDRALDAVRFDPALDRLFSVGDLIDRGPESRRVLSYLREDWFFAVRGNHEDMLLRLYADGFGPDEEALAANVEHNGLGWWLSVPESEQFDILEALVGLPLVMEFPTPRGSVGILHAEVPVSMDWDTFKTNVRRGDGYTLNSVLWRRRRAEQNLTVGVAGIGRIYAGHTWHLSGPRPLGNVHILDTAAVYGWAGEERGGRLSLVNVLAGEHVLTNPRRLRDIDLYEQALSTPFPLPLRKSVVGGFVPAESSIVR